MSYRNGTYVAFNAGGTNIPTESDIKYYNLIKAWTERDDDFGFINSHDKTCAVRDSSCLETLKRRLVERLNNSKNLLLILSSETNDTDSLVNFEIEYALDKCKIPVIVAYTGVDTKISSIANLQQMWPSCLKKRLNSTNSEARSIHIPFKKELIMNAISEFSPNKQPVACISIYNDEFYKKCGM